MQELHPRPGISLRKPLLRNLGSRRQTRERRAIRIEAGRRTPAWPTAVNVCNCLVSIFGLYVVVRFVALGQLYLLAPGLVWGIGEAR